MTVNVSNHIQNPAYLFLYLIFFFKHMRYKQNDQLNSNGSALLEILDDHTAKKIFQRFDYPTNVSWQDDEKGYKYHMIIEDTKLNSIITFYDRFGIWRLGGWDRNVVNEFLNWINQINTEPHLELDLD